jgi:hypothetical protein
MKGDIDENFYRGRINMKKKELKAIRELKQEVNREVAKRLRKKRHEELTEVMAKDKVETYGDVDAIFYGLSKRAKDSAVLDRIFTLARLGNRPTEIIKIMEPKK